MIRIDAIHLEPIHRRQCVDSLSCLLNEAEVKDLAGRNFFDRAAESLLSKLYSASHPTIIHRSVHRLASQIQIVERPDQRAVFDAQVSSRPPLKLRGEGLSQFSTTQDCVIPAWSAGIQIEMDASGRIPVNLDAGYPCRHDEGLYFHVP